MLSWLLGADLGAGCSRSGCSCMSPNGRLVVQLSGAPPCCRQSPNDSCPFSQLDLCTTPLPLTMHPS